MYVLHELQKDTKPYPPQKKNPMEDIEMKILVNNIF